MIFPIINRKSKESKLKKKKNILIIRKDNKMDRWVSLQRNLVCLLVQNEVPRCLSSSPTQKWQHQISQHSRHLVPNTFTSKQSAKRPLIYRKKLLTVTKFTGLNILDSHFYASYYQLKKMTLIPLSQNFTSFPILFLTC